MSLDIKENYKEFQTHPNGVLVPNYSPSDIEYKFNSFGFRCDEFSTYSELPVLFMGCSHTEGIGLPYDVTWPVLLLADIKKQTNKQHMPLWSVAVSASGIDTMARELNNHAYDLKPKYIFGLLNDFYRRDMSINGSIKLWGPHYENIHTPEFNRIAVTEEFAWHESIKSLTTINAVATSLNATVILMVIKNINKKFPLFSNIHLINFENLPFNKEDFDKGKMPFARDLIHAGEYWQRGVSQAFSKYISDISLIKTDRNI